MSTLVQNPFEVILGLDGRGLNGGQVFIGEPDLDPETNPKPVFWNAALTDAATQPLDIIGGYIVRANTPTEAFTNGDYSILVRDRHGVQVFFAPSVGVDNIGAFGLTAVKVATTAISADISMFETSGYSAIGDGGSARYARVASEPTHPGKLEDASGAWWELRESVINPIMFGAKIDGATPADDAFNAMSDYCKAVKNVAEIRLGADPREADTEYPPNSYLMATGWTNRPTWLWLDPGSTEFGTAPVLKISGHGAIVNAAAGADFIRWLPSDQDEAADLIGQTRFVIEGLSGVGAGTGTQYGIAIGATYGLVIRDCWFGALSQGVAALFCLSGELSNIQTINCTERGISLESGEGVYTGLGWSGATNANSASNITLVDKCRVYGSPTQEAALVIYASDSVRVRNFVAEGDGGAVDLIFDYGASSTVKLFTIEGCHFENPNVKLLMRIRCAGVVRLSGIFYQYAAALLDASDSAAPRIVWRDQPYLVPDPVVDPLNPNGWLFFHTDGGGRGGVPGGNSAGAIWDFGQSTPAITYDRYKTPTTWENDTLATTMVLADMPLGGDGPSNFYNSGPLIEVADPRGQRINGALTFEPDDTWGIGRAGLMRPRSIDMGSGGITAVSPSLRLASDNSISLSATLGNGARMSYQGANLNVVPSLVYNASGPTERLRVESTTGHTLPGADNTQNLGSASKRWKEVFAGTGTINTSDARLKTEVRSLDERERTAARALLAEIGLFKFLASIAEKGDGARLHAGMTVQRAMEIMTANDLDPFDYGFICYDAWDAEAELRGVEETIWSQPGEGDDPETFVPQEVTLPAPILRQARAAGDLYSFRPDELILFMVAGLGADVAAILASLETP